MHIKASWDCVSVLPIKQYTLLTRRLYGTLGAECATILAYKLIDLRAY